MEEWGVRRCIYPIVHPYWGTFVQKGKDKETKGIRSVRTICEQIGIKVGRVNEWISEEQRQVGPWEKWISWRQGMSQGMNERVGHTALMKMWNRGRRAVHDGMKQKDGKERETYPKINQTLNTDKTGGCVSPSGDGRWQIGVWWCDIIGAEISPMGDHMVCLSSNRMMPCAIRLDQVSGHGS